MPHPLISLAKHSTEPSNTLHNTPGRSHSHRPGRGRTPRAGSEHSILAPETSTWPQNVPHPLISLAKLSTEPSNTLHNTPGRSHSHRPGRRRTPRAGSEHSILAPETTTWPQNVPHPLISLAKHSTEPSNTLHNTPGRSHSYRPGRGRTPRAGSEHSILAPETSTWPQNVPHPLISLAKHSAEHSNTLHNTPSGAATPTTRERSHAPCSVGTLYLSTRNPNLATECAPPSN